ncbi:MAG: ATP-binding cassette domain-containing protein [Deltaproteobacteria bacterium]|nr:ATP-binding cassette domain-containing protein [Deltaproteobacteria bacterium]MBT4265126.1 ATP-binding cassette domain-containing protein [Deltaproteobacteria bacterium]MBT4640118.1 ATP-binding cassette domain-containing protein [Deltaproteobacteria bacterium]MBT6499490.1 ATP-binding cassette domain-containing protein [Deltaproteobacteria bacterium]MBT6616370.1 ATP-binding cassette domain-containing protein [Deltaproteobacteria bacterium]
MLKLETVQIYIDGRPLFSSLSLEIKPGEIASIMGPSGCGKSTLLSAICGNLADVFVLSGDVSLNERTILALPMEKRRIGILFQDDLLFPHMNIAENLAFALPSEMEKPEKKEKIREALMKAGLSGFEKRDPETLSGGQRARVSLLRSLLAEPEAILLDEPFSKLDQELKDQIRSFVFETIRSMDIPALLVSHDHRDCPQGQIINLANQGE